MTAQQTSLNQQGPRQVSAATSLREDYAHRVIRELKAAGGYDETVLTIVVAACAQIDGGKHSEKRPRPWWSIGGGTLRIGASLPLAQGHLASPCVENEWMLTPKDTWLYTGMQAGRNYLV